MYKYVKYNYRVNLKYLFIYGMFIQIIQQQGIYFVSTFSLYFNSPEKMSRVGRKLHHFVQCINILARDLPILETKWIGKGKKVKDILDIEIWVWVQGLCCLMPLSIIFQLYRGGQFYWWINRSTRRKPPTCRKSLTNFIRE